MSHTHLSFQCKMLSFLEAQLANKIKDELKRRRERRNDLRVCEQDSMGDELNGKRLFRCVVTVFFFFWWWQIIHRGCFNACSALKWTIKSTKSRFFLQKRINVAPWPMTSAYHRRIIQSNLCQWNPTKKRLTYLRFEKKKKKWMKECNKKEAIQIQIWQKMLRWIF